MNKYQHFRQLYLASEHIAVEHQIEIIEIHFRSRTTENRKHILTR